MFLKLVSLIGVLIVLAVTLLVMRQHRLELAHDIANRHQSVQSHRHALWDAQIRTAGLLRPSELRPRLEAVPVALEPATERPIRVNTGFASGRERSGLDLRVSD